MQKAHLNCDIVVFAENWDAGFLDRHDLVEFQCIQQLVLELAVELEVDLVPRDVESHFRKVFKIRSFC